MAQFSEDFKEEIRIAQFWRKQLGDEGYNRFHPAELRRWYQDMQRMGVDEVQLHLRERGERMPMAEVLGISYMAPHPTRQVVDLWIDQHRSSRFPMLSVVFLGLAFILPCICLPSIMSAWPSWMTYQRPGLPNGSSPPLVSQPMAPQAAAMLSQPAAPAGNNPGVPAPIAPPPVGSTLPQTGIGAPSYPVGTSGMETPVTGAQPTGAQPTGAPTR